jgi:hypothetical protein
MYCFSHGAKHQELKLFGLDNSSVKKGSKGRIMAALLAAMCKPLRQSPGIEV